ncbi:MAG: class I SAM-dependent methyltransferase [Candidatus Bathyarchaeia archaeon]
MVGECSEFRLVLDGQRQHWSRVYAGDSDFFGEAPSYAARKVVGLLKAEGKLRVLELGAGQGRDAFFFAGEGFGVVALDYSEKAVEAMVQRARRVKFAGSFEAVCHDVREALPFADGSFDVCYCHMLYCMALCSRELEALFREVWRVLKPGGLSVYTVRHTGDPHYGRGFHCGEDLYENGGFVVHFFSREKVLQLAKGYEILGIEEFEEGELPRKLFLVTLRKKPLFE